MNPLRRFSAEIYSNPSSSISILPYQNCIPRARVLMRHWPADTTCPPEGTNLDSVVCPYRWKTGRPSRQRWISVRDRPLIVAPAYAADRKILADKRISTTLSSGVAGVEEGRVAVLTELSIGGILFPQVPFEVPGGWTFENPAIIGMPVIRRMRMVIDFPHDRIRAVPDARLILQPFRKDRSGLGAMRLPDRLRIVHVAEGSPAAAAGLHAGDEIIAIDDHALDADYFRKHPRDGSRPAGLRSA